MKTFAVRLNADPRSGRPYSAYPTRSEYASMRKGAVGNGFHEAVNFLEESGKVRGYLPPKPAKELQEAEVFNLVSITYKGDPVSPDRIFAVQMNCRFVGSTKRENKFIDNLDWHYICEARDCIVFPKGIEGAFDRLIGGGYVNWFRGGPTKRLDDAKFMEFLQKIDHATVERRGLVRLRHKMSRFSDGYFNLGASFDDQVAAALKTDLRNVTGNPKPSKKLRQIMLYDRDPKVVAFALKRANGVCESCGSDAPFKRQKDGTPFLEVHHKTTLAAGGPDTPEHAIALCPNCHRKSHYG